MLKVCMGGQGFSGTWWPSLILLGSCEMAPSNPAGANRNLPPLQAGESQATAHPTVGIGSATSLLTYGKAEAQGPPRPSLDRYMG